LGIKLLACELWGNKPYPTIVGVSDLCLLWVSKWPQCWGLHMTRSCRWPSEAGGKMTIQNE
jgi:hypothetical protein